MRQVVGFWDRSTGRGTFEGEFGARHELRFGVVRAVGRGIAVLDGRLRRARDRGRFGGLCSPFSQWEMPLDRRR